MDLTVDDKPKALRETLCIAQSLISEWYPGEDHEHLRRLQGLINEIDKHRPLGPDGKHGDRHTATCGCENLIAPYHCHSCTHFVDVGLACPCGGYAYETWSIRYS